MEGPSTSAPTPSSSSSPSSPSFGMPADRAAIKYCAECGAKMPRAQKTCPACGETQ